jgi:PAS domain S-box-containing protein
MRITLRGLARSAELNGRVSIDSRPARRWLPFPVVIVAGGLMLSTPCLPAASDSEALTNVVQVRSLSADEAQRQLPVVIQGAVTYFDRTANILFVQDYTGGISVQGDRLAAPVLRQGKFIQVRGRTGVEGQVPVIRADSAVVLSNAAPFSSKHISLERLATGQEDSQWVSITGVVQSISITRQQRMLTMEISDGKQTVLAHILGFSSSNAPPLHLIHVQARMRGVAKARPGPVVRGMFVGKRPWVGDQLFVPSLNEVTVVQHAPLNVTTRLIWPIKSLLEFQRDDEALHVVKVAGIVTLVSDKQHLYIQDRTGGLLVEVASQPEAKPGQRVEIVGIPDVSGYSPVLRQAQITHVSDAGPVTPLMTTVRETGQGRWDGQLLKLEAELVALVPRRTKPPVLVLQRDGIIFQAQPETLRSLPDLASLRPGSRLQLTGVCRVEPDESLVPQGFSLLLRSEEDVVLRAQPPWWTVRRVLAALGSAIIVVLAWLLFSFRAEAILKEKYRRLFENASDLVCSISPVGRFTALNKAGRKILGLTHTQTLPDGLEGLVPTEDRDRFLKWWAAAVAGEEPVTQEFTISTADGRSVILEISGQLWRPRGKPLEVICIGRDVTGRKQAEEKRIALERKMLDAQKLESLGVLAGGIAHDFNNILTVILGNAALAQSSFPEHSSARTHLDRIQKMSLQAADLCKQMLAYSGKGRFLIEEVNLNTVIQEMWPLLEMSISKKATLEFKAASALPDIEADPSQLRQIVMNLVINASEALEEKPGLITIRTVVTKADSVSLELLHPCVPEVAAGVFVVLEVTDTGCGMTPETQAKILDPFFTTKFVGRGLGLAAVLGVVRAHAGTMQIQSEPGRGSTFRILLPLSKSPTAEEADAPAFSAGTNQDGSRGTVLLVDDDEGVLFVATQMLQKCGFAVITATDGRQAVTKFRAQAASIAAVILDLTMPQMGGDEALEQIRLIRPDARVLLVSGFSEPDPAPRWTTEDRWAFLQKPFKPDDLINALQQLLGDTETSPPPAPYPRPREDRTGVRAGASFN